MRLSHIKVLLTALLFLVVTLNASSQCTPPDLIIESLTDCQPDKIDLNDAIGAGSDPANISFYNFQADANNGANSINATVTASGSYWVRAEDPNDATCYHVYEIKVTLTITHIDTKTSCAPYTWPINGITYPYTNNLVSHTIAGGSVDGCDSIVKLDLTVSQEVETKDVIFSCEPYTWIDGKTYENSNNSATVSLTNKAGCDSIVTLDLTIGGFSDTLKIDTTICANETFTYNGKTYSASGLYYDTLPTTIERAPKDLEYGESQSVISTKNGNYGWGRPILYYDYTSGGASKPYGGGEFSFLKLEEPFWRGNGNVNNSIVNQLAVWNQSIPTNEWYGSTFTIDVPTSKTYYVVLVGDNRFRFSLDGNVEITSDPEEIVIGEGSGSGGANTVTFTWLHIYPFYLTEGCHTITLEGLKIGGQGMFGGAILNNTDVEIAEATQNSDLNYLFSTENVSNFYANPPKATCPDGMEELGASLCDECIDFHCERIVEINLRIEDVMIENHKDEICAGEVFNLHGFSYDATGIYRDTLRNISDCDSIQFTLDLTVIEPQVSTDTHVVCEAFTWPNNGITYPYSNHLVADTIYGGTIDGCDSIVKLDLTVSQDIQTTDKIYSCEPYTWIDGNTYESSNNTASVTLSSSTGCDSIVTLDLRIEDLDTLKIDTTICVNDTFTYNGKTYSASGIYYDTLPSSNKILPKEINYGNSQSVKPAKHRYYGGGEPTLYFDYTPDGASVPYGGGEYSFIKLKAPFWRGSGNVNNSIVNQIGVWDNSITFNEWYGSTFTIDVPTSKTYYVMLVGDNSFRFSLDGVVQITADPDKIIIAEGHDPIGASSVTFTWLHIYPIYLTEGCHTITLEGNNYDDIGMFGGAILNNTDTEIAEATQNSDLNYLFTTENVSTFYADAPTTSCPAGMEPLGPNLCDDCIDFKCERIVEITLRIEDVMVENHIDSICDGDTYTLHGFSYDESGIYKDTLRNINGCDSIQFTLELFLIELPTSIDEVGACDSYTWMDGNTYTSSNNTATYTIPNGGANGCDSIIQLDLTIISTPIADAGSDIEICLGDPVTLTANNPDNADISWDNGVVNGVEFTPTSVGTTIYTLTSSIDSCSAIDQVKVIVHPIPTPSFTVDESKGCEPHTATFTNDTGITTKNCLWDFGDGNTSTNCNTISNTYHTNGLYDITLTITDEHGCTGSLTKKDYINVVTMPFAEFSADPMILRIGNSEVDFTNSSSNANSYIWNFGDESPTVSEVNPSHTYIASDVGSFIVTLIAFNDICSDTTSIELLIKDEIIYYIPNTFTPDGDGANETFQPIFTSGYDPMNFQMLIYNRWGELIFETHNDQVGWNGTYGNNIVKDGVYVWVIKFHEKVNGNKHTEQGFVHVIR